MKEETLIYDCEWLTMEYVKIFQKLYVVRQDIFDSLGLFLGKSAINCSTEQSDFMTIATAFRKQSGCLHSDTKYLRLFESTMTACKIRLNELEIHFNQLENKTTSSRQSTLSNEVRDKRILLRKYFQSNSSNSNEQQSQLQLNVSL